MKSIFCLFRSMPNVPHSQIFVLNKPINGFGISVKSTNYVGASHDWIADAIAHLLQYLRVLLTAVAARVLTI